MTACAGDSAGPTVRETSGSDCGWPPYRPFWQGESQRRAHVLNAHRGSGFGLTRFHGLKNGNDTKCDPGNSDLQSVQNSDEGTEGAHLSQETKVEVPQVQPGQDAEHDLGSERQK